MAFSLALGVTPESMKTKSADINTDIDDMQKYVNALQQEVSGTASYWEGEAGNTQRQNFEDQVTEINNLILRLRTYPTRILQMAGLYEDAEETAVGYAQALSTDIVMK
ncbi:WXG100 family type VII secretion target [Butyrivibrio sp. MC2021]|uniref:WXG100 family type VII secretion target n=1 Tax=Butyrivibrio sp. MC2021 TaxID=1408306 RepID=UPI00047A6A51|nr:WXG100 family type VII secretion target [Butyrivibrio sp. MC2021]